MLRRGIVLLIVLIALSVWCLGASGDLVPADGTHAAAADRPLIAAPCEHADLPGTSDHGTPATAPCIGRVAVALAPEAAADAVRALRAREVDVAGFCTADCFPAETVLPTPDGPRTIEAVRVGDRVRGADGRWEVVAAAHRALATDLVSIHTGQQSLQCTPGHHVLTPAGWTTAERLRAGSFVGTADGGWQRVDRTSRRTLMLPVPVFNLRLASGSSFAIGSGVLVRSKDAPVFQAAPR